MAQIMNQCLHFDWIANHLTYTTHNLINYIFLQRIYTSTPLSVCCSV